MFDGKKVAVSIPAFNEQQLIGKTITTLPDCVDLIVVVDDASHDGTAEVVEGINDNRVRLLRNEVNRGVGYSVVRGLSYALEAGVDVLCIMPGDAQCDPSYLPVLIEHVVNGDCDYAKANRFYHRQALRSMPTFRRLGNIFLTLLTKFATGYYSIFDTQNSYSAIRADTLKSLELEDISPRYEFENSYLLHLSFINARIKDVPVPAIYGQEESTIRLLPFIIRTSRTLLKGFFQRVYRRYVLYNFHPVALFLFSGLAFTLWSLGFGIWAGVQSLGSATASAGTVMLAVLPFLVGFQLLLAAIVLDIINEPR